LDPDETLRLIREKFRPQLDYNKLMGEKYYTIAVAFNDLDEWLSAGGALPKDWERTKK
jgi:hypothetical protein